MSDSNAYQKAIFRTVDEKNTRDLVNPFRFGSTSPKQYKRWSPEISEQERALKKKEREEAYIRSLKETDKPYFLVKSKEVFTDPSDVKEMSDTLQGKYFKVVKSTEPVDSIQADAQRVQRDVRKQTVVHGTAPAEDPFSITSIYKIEGIEYLPEGFLELEPLLYYDEYFFDDTFDEKRFLEEQRKIKHLRRKQYANREQSKKREVTLFVVDQYKDRLAEYLELWYAKNQRRMRDEEIEYVAKELETDFATIAELQEVFLKKKRFENSARLSNYLAAPETRGERVSSLPQELQKHFSSALPKGSVMTQKGSVMQGQPGRPSEVRKSGLAQGEVIEDTPEQKEQKAVYQQELDQVLDKIKRASGLSNKNGSLIEAAEGRRSKSPGSIRNSSRHRQGSPSGVKSRNTQSVEDAMNNIIARSSQVTGSAKGSKLAPSPEGESRVRKSNMDAKVSFVEVDVQGQPINVSQAIELTQKASQAVEERRSLSPSTGERRAKSAVQPGTDSVLRKSNLFTVKSKTVVGLDPAQLKVHRSTVAYKTGDGQIVVEQKLSPTLIGNDYYYQTIRDVIDQQGRHNVSVVTARADGTVIEAKDVSPENLGNFHHSVLVDPGQKGTARSLLIRNEFGDTLSVTNVPSVAPNPSTKSIHAVVGPDGERKSTVRVMNVRNNSLVAHSLQPVLVGDEYYQQLVIHAIGQLGRPTIVVTTTDEAGREVFSNQVAAELAGESYVTEVVVEPQTDGSLKKSILTINERGQTVAANSLVVSAGELNHGLGAPVVVEVFDNANGRQTCNFSQISPQSPSKVSKRTLIKSSQLGNSYYIEVERDEVRPDGSRVVTLVARDGQGISVARKTHAPTVMGLIGEDYFADMENQVEEVIKQTDEKIMVAPSVENLTLRVEEDVVTDKAQRSLVVSVVDASGRSVAKQTYRPTIDEVLGEHYFDDLIEKAESVIREQKVTELKKQSLVPQRISTFANRHTFGSNSQESGQAEAKNMFFVKLLETAEVSRHSIGEVTTPRFTGLQGKPKSHSAMAGVGDSLRFSQTQAGTNSSARVVTSQRSAKNGTLVTFAEENGVPSRNNTAIGSGGVIKDEELVKISGGPWTPGRSGASPNRLNNVFEGGYTDQGRVPNTDSQRAKSPQTNTSVFLKTISSINPHESIIENNNQILQKSREMKAHLDAYIDSIEKINESQMQESQRLQHPVGVTLQLDDEVLRAKVHEVFNQEKEKMGEQILRQLQGAKEPARKESDLMDEFYAFCRDKLPSDDMYKESVLFVSLFYYFLEKKNLIK